MLLVKHRRFTYVKQPKVKCKRIANKTIVLEGVVNKNISRYPWSLLRLHNRQLPVSDRPLSFCSECCVDSTPVSAAVNKSSIQRSGPSRRQSGLSFSSVDDVISMTRNIPNKPQPRMANSVIGSSLPSKIVSLPTGCGF